MHLNSEIHDFALKGHVYKESHSMKHIIGVLHFFLSNTVMYLYVVRALHSIP